MAARAYWKGYLKLSLVHKRAIHEPAQRFQARHRFLSPTRSDHFRVRALGQMAVGNVQVAEDNVRLEVTLPWLLQKFGKAVLKTISGRGRILLEKK